MERLNPGIYQIVRCGKDKRNLGMLVELTGVCGSMANTYYIKAAISREQIRVRRERTITAETCHIKGYRLKFIAELRRGK